MAFSALRPLTSALSGIFLVFIVFNLLDLPPHAVVPVVVWDAVLVVCFIGLRIAIGRDLIPVHLAHPTIASIAALVVSNVLLTFSLLSDPFFTSYISLVVVGGGYIILSVPWLIGLLSVILVAWTIVAWQATTFQEFLHYGFTLAVAMAMAFVVHIIRTRTYRRLETLRLSNEQQKQALEVALEASRHELAERRNAEAQLLQAQKMEAVGRLAGGVAHDMNNMLGAIMGFADVLKMDMQSASPLREDVKSIIKACNRGRALTQNLLGFARKGKYLREEISLNSVIEEVTGLLDRTISKRIEVCCDLADDLPPMEGDPNQIQQVLLNLALNAADALDGVGELSFTTRCVSLRADDLHMNAELSPGLYVELRVSDTGIGMDDETLAHVFEPFFTTKEMGAGTGLGLSMVYGTIQNHGGRVHIVSAPDQGTTVTIQVPALPGRVRKRTVSRPTSRRRLSVGADMVLLVDDEEIIRTSCKKMLEALGYSVTLAANGQEAIIQFRELSEHIVLVILDRMMPEMDGREACIALREIDPTIKVLFSSGYSQDHGMNGLLEDASTLFIQKPFDLDALEAKLDEALAPPESEEDS